MQNDRKKHHVFFFKTMNSLFKKSGESVPLQLSLHHNSLSFSILIETLENPIYVSLTDILFNISQLHNNMHVQINMNFTKKKVDMDCKMSKNTFKMYHEIQTSFPCFLNSTSSIELFQLSIWSQMRLAFAFYA